MGGRRWFNVESKSFEFALEASGVCIIERGRNSTSSITLGKEGAHWLGSGMTETTLLSADHGFVRTCREAGRFVVLQKNKNYLGRYVFVTEYGAKSRKGLVVILEGHDRWKWRGFSLVLNGKSQPAVSQAGTSKWVSWPPSSHAGNRNPKVGKSQLSPQFSLF